jgi:hypothetical protein
MAFRKTGSFHPAEEMSVLTCDVCERDLGYEDGRRVRAHLRMTRHPNAGGLNEQDPPAVLCSRECLPAYAATLTGLDREPGLPKAEAAAADADARGAVRMMIVVVGCLVIVSLYLAKRVTDVSTENAALRGQIASLKKQLARRRS